MPRTHRPQAVKVGFSWPAFKGNRWREENLAKRGYEYVGTVEAETADAAVAQQARAA